MPLSTIFQWRSIFIGGENRSTRRKPPTCPMQVNGKLYHIMVYRSTPRLSGIRTQC